MRLLQINKHGGLSLTEEFHNEIPPYAILSHTWGREEVTFRDFVDGTAHKKSGYRKIFWCGKQAAHDGLQFLWVDTCCINKSSSAELTEAINSMFAWYQHAEKCYAYLYDVSWPGLESRGPVPKRTLQELSRSRWFTRSWTLQELLAPKSVEFFTAGWVRIGDKHSLLQEIHETTRIPIRAIEGAALSEFSVEERLSWASQRTATHQEDEAYSLLGIFGIFLPTIYGEGKFAYARLLRK
ncbi:heterokaryon incompatibility, partial [Ophiobolus disseminans]